MTINANKSITRSSFIPAIVFSFSCILYAYIAYCAPFTSDDMEFAGYGFTSLSDMVQFVLYYGNGRFLGNLCTQVLISNLFLRIFVKALTMSSIIVLLPRVLSLRSNMSYLASFLLITGMAPRVFAQVYAWTSGFGNYIPPIALTLLILDIYIYWKRNKCIAAFFVFCFGVSSQLFVEHNTILNVVLSFIIMISATKHKNRNAFLAQIWFFATVIGALLMFFLPKIFYLPENPTELYRNVASGSITVIANRIVDNSSELYDFLLSNKTVMIVLAVLGILLTVQCHTFDKNKPFVYVIGVVYILFFFFSHGYWWGRNGFLVKLLSILLSSSIVLGACFSIASTVNDFYRRLIVLSIFLIIVSVAPLLIVHPIGERLLLLPYICTVAIALIGIDKTYSCFSNNIVVKRTVCIMVLLFSLLLCGIYTRAHCMDKLRTQHILNEVQDGHQQIQIFDIPFNYTFTAGTWAYERQYYYVEWGDIEFDLISYDDWIAQYGNN